MTALGWWVLKVKLWPNMFPGVIGMYFRKKQAIIAKKRIKKGFPKANVVIEKRPIEEAEAAVAEAAKGCFAGPDGGDCPWLNDHSAKRRGRPNAR